MYDELVARLRDDEAWKNCDFDFIYDWMHQAADAIEELSKMVSADDARAYLDRDNLMNTLMERKKSFDLRDRYGDCCCNDIPRLYAGAAEGRKPMRDDLLRRLRDAAQGRECNGKKMEWDFQKQLLYNEAADAIEELITKLEWAEKPGGMSSW